LRFLTRLCKSYLKRQGFYIVSKNTENSDELYRLSKYETSDGAFDYDRYVSVQTDGNKRKINNVWATEELIQHISEYLKSSDLPHKTGLCHGSRNGTEVRWFQKHLSTEVTGTDISDTAADFGLVQWDFHEVNDEWIKKFDFIYTNSHDHAYDPEKAFGTWINQLTPNGRLFIEHTVSHTPTGVSDLDPFGIEFHSFPYFILGIGKGKFAVSEILHPANTGRSEPTMIYVIKKL